MKNKASTTPDYHYLARVTAQVYRLFDAKGILLYIGCSMNPSMRIPCHRSRHRGWFDKVRTITLSKRIKRPLALRAERTAIMLEKPKYNPRQDYKNILPLKAEKAKRA